MTIRNLTWEEFEDACPQCFHYICTSPQRCVVNRDTLELEDAETLASFVHRAWFQI